MITNKPGIYKLSINNKHYYGRSVNVGQRIAEHLSKLRRGKHSNFILQNLYKKYKKIECEQLVITSRELEDMQDWEQYYIDNFPNINISKSSKGGGMYERKHTKESKVKISKGMKNHKNKQILRDWYHPDYGIIEKVSARELSRRFNLYNSTLSKVVKGKYPRHKGWEHRQA